MPRRAPTLKRPVRVEAVVRYTQPEDPAAVKARQRRRALPTNSRSWRSLRQKVLAEQPLCPECEREGRIGAAREVDHVDGNARNNERSNLQGLCKSHHSRKTARENGGFGNRREGRS